MVMYRICCRQSRRTTYTKNKKKHAANFADKLQSFDETRLSCGGRGRRRHVYAQSDTPTQSDTPVRSCTNTANAPKIDVYTIWNSTPATTVRTACPCRSHSAAWWRWAEWKGHMHPKRAVEPKQVKLKFKPMVEKVSDAGDVSCAGNKHARRVSRTANTPLLFQLCCGTDEGTRVCCETIQRIV